MNFPLIPLVNGKSYEWANIIANILGVPINGISAIEYEERQAMENVYGAGSDPVSRIYGKTEPTAKVTMTMEEVENIMTVAPLGKLQRIPEFDISILYLDDSRETKKHKLRNCRLMNNGRKSATGDGAIQVELELVISHIEWQ